MFESLLNAEGYTTENDVLGIATKSEKEEIELHSFIDGEDNSPGFLSSMFTFLGKRSKG